MSDMSILQSSMRFGIKIALNKPKNATYGVFKTIATYDELLFHHSFYLGEKSVLMLY